MTTRNVRRSRTRYLHAFSSAHRSRRYLPPSPQFCSPATASYHRSRRRLSLNSVHAFTPSTLLTQYYLVLKSRANSMQKRAPNFIISIQLTFLTETKGPHRPVTCGARTLMPLKTRKTTTKVGDAATEPRRLRPSLQLDASGNMGVVGDFLRGTALSVPLKNTRTIADFKSWSTRWPSYCNAKRLILRSFSTANRTIFSHLTRPSTSGIRNRHRNYSNICRRCRSSSLNKR